MAANPALEQHLLSAAARLLGADLEKLIPKTALKKANPSAYYTEYDMTLGQFYVPGRTKKEDPTEEHKLLAGLKVMSEKLRKENEALRNLVRSEAAKAEQRGYDKGLAAGLEQGTKKGKSEAVAAVNTIKSSVAKVVQQIEREREPLLHASEGKILELALSAAEAIVDNEITSSTETVLHVIRKSLTEIAATDKVTIRVNPSEVESVEEGRGFWHSINTQLKEVKIEPDTRIAKGGCMIESPGGCVDARIDVQLKAVRELFMKHWKDKGATP